MKNKNLPLGAITCLQQSIPYVAAPTRYYTALCQAKPFNLLLESADIDSKQNLKSLMLIDTAVRIVCYGNQITFTAETENGRHALDAIMQRAISQQHFDIKHHEQELILTLIAAPPALDEASKLHQPSTLDALRLCLQAFALDDNENDHALFLGGLFSYDLVEQFEPLPALPNTRCPDFIFYLAQTLLVIDHQRQSATLQATLFDGPFASTHHANLIARLKTLKQQCLQLPTSSQMQVDACAGSQAACYTPEASISDLEFCNTVNALKKYVNQGDVFQVVPSRHFSLPCPDPLAAYQQLKQTNPSPYMFFLQDAQFCLFGASPESALKYSQQTNQIEIYPIAGTRARGKKADGSIDLDLDGRIELGLRRDQKENAEHMMLVDLARNDVARISAPGTRYVAELLKVDRYSHVMHLVSRVVGQLAPELDALSAYQACMNMGTLTGAPKVRAMQLIRQFEPVKRGAYGGAIGYLNGKGDLDTCIVIRSAFVEQGIAKVQAGAGVVFDSIPQAEADETRAKAQAVINAIIHANQQAAKGA